MTGSEYQDQVAELDNPNLQGFNRLRLAVCNLDAEASTLMRQVQAAESEGLRYSRKRFATSLGDALYAIALSCDAIGVSMDYIMLDSISRHAERRGGNNSNA